MRVAGSGWGWSDTGRTAILGLVYFASTALTVRFTRFDGGVAFFWGGTALLLAVLMTSPPRRWIPISASCLIGGSVAASLYGLGPWAAGPLSLVSIGEAVLGAWAMRRWYPTCGTFQSVREIGRFLMIAGLACPAASALLGGGIVHQVAHLPYWPNVMAWFTAHALGTLIVTPPMLLARRGDREDWAQAATRAQRAEAVLLLAVLAGVSAAVFAQVTWPVLFVPFLPMMITVFRLGRLGASCSAVILTVIASYFTLRGSGPIALIHGGSGLRAQFLQFYLGSAVIMALSAAGDLRRRQRVLIGLQEQNALHKLILDRTDDVILTLGLDGRIRYASPSVEGILGRTPASLIGTMPHSFVHPDDVGTAIAAHRQALIQPERAFAAEYRVITKDQTLGWFESHSRATIDNEGRPTGVVGIIRDTSQRKAIEADLEHGAHTDPLTGIDNRRAFDRAMATRAALPDSAGPAALAMFDLDHFKRVNDRYGHPAGDEALRVFAGLLRLTLRDRDLVARVGGEEFVAVLDCADLPQAQAVCERVRRGMADTWMTAADGQSFQVTVSAGIAMLTPGVAAEEVIAAADAALYRAKTSGRNRLSLAS